MSKPLHRVATGAHVALFFVLCGIFYFAVHARRHHRPRRSGPVGAG